MKLYRSLLFGVSLLAVASAYAAESDDEFGGKENSHNTAQQGSPKSEHTSASSEKDPHAASSMKVEKEEVEATDEKPVPALSVLVPNILAREKDEDRQLNLIAALYKGATPEMVRLALRESFVAPLSDENSAEPVFSYELFLKSLRQNQEQELSDTYANGFLFSEDYLPRDMLGEIIKNGTMIAEEDQTNIGMTRGDLVNLTDAFPDVKKRTYAKAGFEELRLALVVRAQTLAPYIQLFNKWANAKTYKKLNKYSRRFTDNYIELTYMSKWEQNAIHEELSPEGQALFESKIYFPINLSGNIDDQLEKMPDFPLSLEVKEWNPKALEELLTKGNVRSLFISHKLVDDEGFETLAKLLKGNKSLKSLVLRGNVVLSNTPNHLGGLTPIQYTASTKGIKALAEALKENDTLEELALGQNGINFAGVKELVIMLETNKTLKSLNLHDNFIDIEGAKLFANMFFQKKNTTLKSLNLGLNYLGVEGVELLMQALVYSNTLQTLDVAANRFSWLESKRTRELEQEIQKINKEKLRVVGY